MTVFRLRYCNASMLIPPPFNLLPRAETIIRFLCRRANGGGKEASEAAMLNDREEDMAEIAEEKFKKLQRQLHRRFLNGQKGKSESNEILEHTLEILHDTNTIVNLGREIKNNLTNDRCQ